jgi:hypothetical protein
MLVPGVSDFRGGAHCRAGLTLIMGTGWGWYSGSDARADRCRQPAIMQTAMHASILPATRYASACWIASNTPRIRRYQNTMRTAS